ncbi:hypothetical protein KDI_38970 [Dictyobacter arantiisoli]|uniref:Lycopene cyclase domain-containing protein n=1 Tax=Dictyobacter arantiisoli TaxID=2014874 RepID=A0A5A5TGZ3_9CHLR|nr:hypothetical protein KDI_38970 [Dictyobacter arantiisoli]
MHIEPLGRYMFFPLWLGYIFFMDALVFSRHGTSLLRRMRWRYPFLFLVSSLFWWFFEGMNNAVQNWHYVLDQAYNPLVYVLLASISFSTVLPAVLETTEFFCTFLCWQPRLLAHDAGPRLPVPMLVGLELIGLACFILPLAFPGYCFALIWLSLIFMLDPINNFMGRKSTLAHIAVGDWRFFVLPLGGLTCGFFWEMWNYFSLPKWYYTVPYIGFWKIFEMPLLGYVGYLPFSLELFALYQCVLWMIARKRDFLVI